jgi:two-component sensor histidine kinase
MIFGCPDFLSAFQPEKMLGSIDNIPRLRLSEMVVNGKPYPADTSRKMKFDHTSNNFIFRWAVTDYNDPLNNRYYYQLQGIDKDWHFVGKSGEVEFASLSPGNYTLLLKGENSNGITAANIIKIGFYIRLPFWRTWWFLTLLFCAIGGIFYSTYRYRLNQHLKIEKLRNKISLDLHDDIGSTLSSISILSDMALHGKKNTEPERENMLKEIKENSISLMEKMDDIVWSINPKNDSLINLFTRIQSFASKLFEAKEINYQINIGENIKNVRLPMEFRQHIYLIMKEAINNLVKYSDCTEARINVSNQSSLLSISIMDNGKGFDTQKAVSGNGIMSMKKRAEMMKAHIEIQSEKDKGTGVNLSVKIK